MRKHVLALTVLLALPVAAQAQKKALTQADWDTWKSINAPALSPDGKWAVYTLIPQVGDGEMIVRSTTGSTEYHVPRGFLGRPNNTPGGLRGPAGAGGPEEGGPAGPTATPPQITSDSRYVIVQTQAPQAEVERAGRGRGAAAVANRQSLVILSLADGKTTTIDAVRSFRLPRDNGTWLAYVAADSAAAGDSSRAPVTAAGGGRGGRGGRGGGGAPAGRRQFGNALVLRNLATGVEERLADVLTFAFDDSAKVLGYTVVSRDSTKDGAFLRTLASGATTTLLSGHGDYKGLAFDRTGTQVLFVADRDEFGQTKPRYAIYQASTKGGTAQAVVSPNAVPQGLHIADNGPVAFNRTATAITFNIAPPPIDSVPADSLVGKAVFDLWNYKDPTLQPAQKLSAQRDRNKTYQAVYFTANKKIVKLADDSIPTVTLSDDSKIAVANSREHYMIESMWGDGATDVYLIDATTGARKVVKEHIQGNGQLSPDAKYVTYYDNGHWYSYTVATGKTADLNATAKGVSFAQETHDTPDAPPAWGIAGWTKGDQAVLIYDRYDIWNVDPTGARPAIVLTDSVGRKSTIQFRLAEGGGGGRGGGGRGGGRGGAGAGDDRGIDPNEPQMLRATNTETMASGFYRTRVDSRKAPEKV